MYVSSRSSISISHKCPCPSTNRFIMFIHPSGVDSLQGVHSSWPQDSWDETSNGCYDIGAFIHNSDGASAKTTLSILKRVKIHTATIYTSSRMGLTGLQSRHQHQPAPPQSTVHVHDSTKTRILD